MSPFLFFVLRFLYHRIPPHKRVRELRSKATLLTSKLKVKLCIYAAVLSAVVLFLIVDTANNRSRLVSAGGLVLLVILGAIFSKYPRLGLWIMLRFDQE